MAEPLSIVHVVRSPVGGVFRHIADLARSQSEAGHTVGLIADSTTGAPLEAERLAALAPSLSLGVARLPMGRSISPGDLPAAYHVARHVGRMRADIIHSHGAKGGVFGRLSGAMLRSRSTVVFYAPHGGSLHYEKASVAGRVYFAVERGLERITDGLIHVSTYEAAVYRDKVGMPRCPAHVVVNGLRHAEFEPVKEALDPADFLFIGELRDLKGADTFVEALLALRGEGARPRAAVVGSGAPADVERYRRMAVPLGAEIAFLPRMPAREAFALARTVVVPSRAESMPYIVLEAIAAGRPLIATDVGGIPEILDGPGERLVPPSDPVALARAMRLAIDFPDRMAAEAVQRRDRIRQKFSLSAMAARIEGIYRGALEHRIERPVESALEADLSR